MFRRRKTGKGIRLKEGGFVEWVFHAGDAAYKCNLSVLPGEHGKYRCYYRVAPTGLITMFEGCRHLESTRPEYDEAEDAYNFCKMKLRSELCPEDLASDFMERVWQTDS